MRAAGRSGLPRHFRSIAAVVGLVIGLAATALSRVIFPAPELAGHAHVVDGDTLVLAASRVRLAGIDAPELDQSCTSKSGQDYPCGRQARDWLIDHLRGQSVTCAGQGDDSYGRILATCSANGTDIGEQIVRAGWAIAENPYRDAEKAARAAEAGIWQGAFMRPSQWRKAPEREGGLWAWIRNWFS